MTQGVLKTHGICLMMYFKNNWNAGPFFLLHGYFRRKKTYIYGSFHRVGENRRWHQKTYFFLICIMLIMFIFVCTMYLLNKKT